VIVSSENNIVNVSTDDGCEQWMTEHFLPQSTGESSKQGRRRV